MVMGPQCLLISWYAIDLDVCTAEHRSRGLLPEPAVREIEAAVAAAAAECLPDWDDLYESLTSGRGMADEYVHSVRASVQGARVALLARLGSHYLARRDAGRAVSILDEAFRLDPDLPGLAEELAKALEAASHRVRAAEVRKRYVLRE
jgi:hypothetical protein